MSQLLARLDKALVSAETMDDRAELLARKACYLGRVGRFDDAKAIIDDLRTHYGDGHSGRVTVWIMLAEGLGLHFAELSPKALDRISRAVILGQAMQYPKIIALAAAWKAHIEFQSGAFKAMVRSIELSTQNSSPEDFDAITRRSIVLCNSHMICGEREVAQGWFEVARRAAVENGDQASLEALIYNRAAFLTTWLRAENCISPVGVDALRSVRMEISSARNFQDLTGVAALTVHIHLWDARQFLLSGEYALAVEKLTSIRGELPEMDESFSRAFIDLEICYCLVQQGQISAAADLFSKLPVMDLGKLDVDEQLVAAWMRLGMARRDDRFGESTSLTEEFKHLAERYADYKRNLATLLSESRNTSTQ